MTNIELLIKNNYNFISNFSEYKKSTIDINTKIIKFKNILININNSKNLLINSLENKDKSTSVFKYYFCNEKKKIKTIINEYIKEKQLYQTYNKNQYNEFIKSIEDIILSNPIINEICNITCPICLDTKITCMVKLISSNNHSIENNNNIINMSNCKGTIICYDCSINMYNRIKSNHLNEYLCILCNKKIQFNINEPLFNILNSHTKIIDTILKNEYYIFEEKMNIILPYIIIYDNIKFKYLKDLNLFLINKIIKNKKNNNNINSTLDDLESIASN